MAKFATPFTVLIVGLAITLIPVQVPRFFSPFTLVGAIVVVIGTVLLARVHRPALIAVLAAVGALGFEMTYDAMVMWRTLAPSPRVEQLESNARIAEHSAGSILFAVLLWMILTVARDVLAASGRMGEADVVARRRFWVAWLGAALAVAGSALAIAGIKIVWDLGVWAWPLVLLVGAAAIATLVMVFGSLVTARRVAVQIRTESDARTAAATV
ncbi:MAG TPA: hypothetical protein VGB18_00945 [Candidatus Thermoplasmatota archaeon]